jgi:hypothetical protein
MFRRLGVLFDPDGHLLIKKLRSEREIDYSVVEADH